MTDETAAPQPTPVTTAFLVMQNINGDWVANSDINLLILPERPASRDDMKAGASCVVLDCQTQEIIKQTTVSVIQNMMAITQQIAQARNGPQVPAGMDVPGGVPLLGRG